MHTAESHAGGFAGAFLETYAIVVYSQPGAVLSSRQGQDNAVCLPMLDSVTDGFLCDTIEMRGDGVVRHGGQAVTRHLTGQAEEVFGLQSKVLQGHDKTFPLELNG
jgi:hypothetical protein